MVWPTFSTLSAEFCQVLANMQPTLSQTHSKFASKLRHLSYLVTNARKDASESWLSRYMLFNLKLQVCPPALMYVWWPLHEPQQVMPRSQGNVRDCRRGGGHGSILVAAPVSGLQ